MNSKTRIVAVSVIGLGLLLALINSHAKPSAPEADDTVRTHCLQVVDKSNHVRCLISALPDGSMEMTMYSKSGARALNFSTDNAGATMLTVMAESGKSMGSIIIDPDGNPTLFLKNAKAKTKVVSP